jgi:methionine synthase I (cobalamin-dependent)
MRVFFIFDGDVDMVEKTAIQKRLQEKILILDGAMGTM